MGMFQHCSWLEGDLQLYILSNLILAHSLSLSLNFSKALSSAGALNTVLGLVQYLSAWWNCGQELGVFRMVVNGGKWETAKEAPWLLTMHRVHSLGDRLTWILGANSVPTLPWQQRPNHHAHPSGYHPFAKSSAQFYVMPVVTKAPPPPEYGLFFVILFFSCMRKGCSKNIYLSAIFKFNSKIWLLSFSHFIVFFSKSRWLIPSLWNGWWWWWSRTVS